MEVSFLVGFLLMWLAIIIARRVSLKEIQLLSNEKKVELVDMVTGRRGMQIAVLVVGLAAYYMINLLVEADRGLYFGLYSLFIVIWILYRNNQTFKEYRNRDFSPEFIRSQKNAAIIRLSGIIAFLVCIGLNFVLLKSVSVLSD